MQNLDLRLRACYTYDAWGNHRVFKVNADGSQADITDLTAADNASHIGNVNPIHYRSYYFDAETNLYFLQSRYYDPETGRFINADDISVLDETALDVDHRWRPRVYVERLGSDLHRLVTV